MDASIHWNYTPDATEGERKQAIRHLYFALTQNLCENPNSEASRERRKAIIAKFRQWRKP